MNISKKNKNNSKILSLNSKLMMALGTLLFACIFIVSILAIITSRKSVQKSTLETMQTGVQGVSETLRFKIISEINEMNTYSENKDLVQLLSYSKDQLEAGDETVTAIQSQFTKRFADKVSKDSEILNMYVINKDGLIYTSMFPDAVGTDVSDRDYFKDAFAKKGIVVSDVVYSDRLSANVTMISTGIYNGDQIVGVITSVLSTEAYTNAMSNFSNSSLSFFITDKAGNAVYTNKEENIGKPMTNDDMIAVANGQKGDSGNIENNIKVSTYYTMPDIGWKVIEYGDKKDIYKSVTTLTLTLTIIGVAALGISMALLFILSKTITAPIKKITNQVKLIADGDLTVDVEENHSSQEMLNLTQSFSTMVHNLSSLIAETSNTIEKVDSSSTNLCAISEEVTASNTEISRQVNMITESTTKQANDAQISSEKTVELGSSIEHLEYKNTEMEKQGQNVSNSLSISNEKLKYLLSSNDESKESFTAVKDTVEELINQISEISNIINVIDNISKQTSLLSLNASIESARAGEAGKGFAVVAAEIRGLADDVHTATDNIAAIIKKVEGTVSITRKTLVTSETINENQTKAYKDVTTVFEEMEHALNDMIQITGSISQEISSVSSKKDEMLVLIEGVSTEAQEIAAITEEINTSIEEQASAFDNVNIGAEELIELSQNVRESIDKFHI